MKTAEETRAETIKAIPGVVGERMFGIEREIERAKKSGLFTYEMIMGPADAHIVAKCAEKLEEHGYTCAVVEPYMYPGERPPLAPPRMIISWLGVLMLLMSVGCRGVVMTEAKQSMAFTSHLGQVWDADIREAVDDLNKQIGCEAVIISGSGVPIVHDTDRLDARAARDNIKRVCGVAYAEAIFLHESLVDPIKLYFVLQHEMAHVLGLPDKDTLKKYDLMNGRICQHVGFTQLNAPVLSRHDRRKLRKAYCSKVPVK